MKRLFDLLVASFTLIVVLPLMIIVSFLIYINLGRPILFKQKRPGFKGEPFCIYKFRTMTDEKDKDGNLLCDADRLPPFGRVVRKLSLDELPQLFNVIKGDLSLVGPRPLLMEYLPLYTKEQARRHDVKPGITGWAQVHGRNAISWEERLRLDVWYVDNRSLCLDMKILFLTLCKVLKAEGVRQPGQATMSKFEGNKKDV